MKTIRITRGKEKLYNENKIKVFVNDKLVGKLKQKQSQKFQIHDESNEIYAKTTLMYKSPTIKFQREEDVEFEIKMNPSLRIHPFLIVLPYIPIYVQIMIKFDNVYIKIAASLVLSALFVAAIIQGRRALKEGVLITNEKLI